MLLRSATFSGVLNGFPWFLFLFSGVFRCSGVLAFWRFPMFSSVVLRFRTFCGVPVFRRSPVFSVLEAFSGVLRRSPVFSGVPLFRCSGVCLRLHVFPYDLCCRLFPVFLFPFFLVVLCSGVPACS